MTAPSSGIDRRQLIKAGAWAAPVLAVSVATPVAMASPLVMTVANTTTISGVNLNAGATASTSTSVQVTATLSIKVTSTGVQVHTQTLQLTDPTAPPPYVVAFAFTRFQKPGGNQDRTNYTYTITFSATGYAAPTPITGTW